jgi:hypothetical protein
MRAIVQERFGPPDVPQFADTDPPEADADDVLIRVHTTPGLVRSISAAHVVDYTTEDFTDGCAARRCAAARTWLRWAPQGRALAAPARPAR